MSDINSINDEFRVLESGLKTELSKLEKEKHHIENSQIVVQQIENPIPKIIKRQDHIREILEGRIWADRPKEQFDQEPFARSERFLWLDARDH